MRDVAGGETQSVELGQLGVRWHPRQRRLQPCERSTQYLAHQRMQRNSFKRFKQNVSVIMRLE